MLLRVQDTGKNRIIVIQNLAKRSLVDELRSQVASAWDIADLSSLILIVKGKVLEDGQTLLAYQLDDGLTILAQERLRKIRTSTESSESSKPATDSENIESRNDMEEMELAESEYFDVGQAVDVMDPDGCWYEGKIEKICKKRTVETIRQHQPTVDEGQENLSEINRDRNIIPDDGLLYYCRFERGDEECGPLPLFRIRPRATRKISTDEICNESTNDTNSARHRYLVNYNVHVPGELGNWYMADIKIDGSTMKRRQRCVPATIYIGRGDELIPMANVQISKIDEIYVLPPLCPKQESPILNGEPKSASRTYLDCDRCFDNPTKKHSCVYCTCVVCRKMDNDDKLLRCDECDEAYHTYCLSPPLAHVPDGDWYCTLCEVKKDEIVKIGETSKLMTKRMSKMPSINCKRRWGGGVSCDGVSKKCNIVPKNHFGPIPGVEVGTCWRYRKQVSEAGVHRPLVAGMSGTANEGSYSVVVSGGYADNEDRGDRIIYTGSGGRDLSGNKRSAGQSADQTLDRTNAALARNCYRKTANLSQEGHNAGENWKKGKPVRVVRSHKLKSEYSPDEGFRYDGIYKVVKYWPEKGSEGYKVWRYELRRDDGTPAPWTNEGKKRIRQMGLDKIIEAEDGVENEGSISSVKDEETEDVQQPKAKQKRLTYELPKQQLKLIEKDSKNKSKWLECLNETPNGQMAFFKKVHETFVCAICQETVYQPITLTCGHSLCTPCILTAEKNGYEDCPTCRKPMTDKAANVQLGEALESLMPGYGKGRGGKN